MIIMKFGGTSVGTADRILIACKLVKDNIKHDPLVVLSAHNSDRYRMTDMLIETANRALNGDPDSTEIRSHQTGICDDLEIPASRVEYLLNELDEVLRGINLIGEISNRTLDRVMSYGERMSTIVFTEVLKNRFDVDAVRVPSYELGFRTDSNYGMASPDRSSFPEIRKNVESLEGKVIVTTGFIGESPEGFVTTLGRGGSDLSATLFGAAVGAEEIQIWTDVDGVMTADPNIVPDAKLVPELSFMEAAELAWFGARVLHPLSMLPAIENDIPVRVLNTYRPDCPGTKIVSELNEHPEIAKSVAYKKNITLVTITTPKMLGVHGFLARAFAVFAKYKLDIHMIATAEISFSLTIPGDISRDMKCATEEIREFADVIVEPDKAVVCIIGENMARSIGASARAIKAVSDADVRIRMISQEAHEYNISLLVDESDVEKTVLALHREFFG